MRNRRIEILYWFCRPLFNVCQSRRNQLEFGLKSANPRKRERDWEREKLSHDKGPNGNLNMSPVGQSRQSIKMARKNKTKPTTTTARESKERKTSFWPYSECSSSVYAVGCMHHCIRVWHPTRNQNRNRTGSLKQIVLYLYSIYVGKSVQQ